MRKRKATTKYISATAMIWDTCYEVVANRWIGIVGLYHLHGAGK